MFKDDPSQTPESLSLLSPSTSGPNLLNDLPSHTFAATGEHLYNSLMATFTHFNIPKENMIGFDSDGCNVMMGEHNSAASRLRISCPGIFIIKCICHSAHICASEACKQLPRSCEDLARNIYNFLHSSAKRQSTLRQFQKLSEVKPAKIFSD